MSFGENNFEKKKKILVANAYKGVYTWLTTFSLINPWEHPNAPYSISFLRHFAVDVVGPFCIGVVSVLIFFFFLKVI